MEWKIQSLDDLTRERSFTGLTRPSQYLDESLRRAHSCEQASIQGGATEFCSAHDLLNTLSNFNMTQVACSGEQLDIQLR